MLSGDVHRLELPTPFAIGPVSTYVLRGDPLTLVDPGPLRDKTSAALDDGLRELGLRVDTGDEELGEPGDVVWYPDRTWHGRTFVPATVPTANGYELYGYVSYAPGGDGEEPADFHSEADFTAETAAKHSDWKIDLTDEVIGTWRGEQGKAAAMTLVWGRPMVEGAVVATAELADLVVDQCVLLEGRFTLIAPDDYRGDTLDVRLWDGRGRELAVESLYED